MWEIRRPSLSGCYPRVHQDNQRHDIAPSVKRSNLGLEGICPLARTGIEVGVRDDNGRDAPTTSRHPLRLQLANRSFPTSAGFFPTSAGRGNYIKPTKEKSSTHVRIMVEDSLTDPSALMASMVG
jgi:hypothetical protein